MPNDSLTIARFEFLKSLPIEQLTRLYEVKVGPIVEKNVIHMMIMTHYAERLLTTLVNPIDREKRN